MFKLLRNLLLVAILLAGTLKLLAWYAVGHDAERVTEAFAPYGQFKYDGLSAGLDGSVTIDNVSLTRGPHEVYRADTATLQTPGLFWLLKHTLLHETDLPQKLGLSAHGLHLPTPAWLDPQFIDASTFVPFAAAGCGAPFTPADLHRMGAPIAITDGQAEYRYQPEQHSVDVSATLSTPGYSSLRLRGDLHPFDPGALTNPSMWQKLHAGQLAADFSDDGFIARRNPFCAQRVGTTPVDFAARHVAAVQEILADHGVQPSSELLQLYRSLTERGGATSVLSLPRNTFVLSNWQDSSHEDLLRQLNITARYRDTPPVMFRLTFTAPADSDATDTIANGVTAPPAGAANVPPAVSPTAMVVTPSTNQKPVVTSSPPPSIAAPSATPKPKTADNMGLHDLDRVEAKLAPKTAPVAAPPIDPVKASEPEPTEFASGPAPAPGSTLSLVWKPTIERLPPPAPAKVDYDVIDYAGLQNLSGRRVRLVTDGNKRIEGFVINADGNSVRLRIGRNDGDAQFDVPKKRIQQIQLLRRTPPA